MDKLGQNKNDFFVVNKKIFIRSHKNVSGNEII